MFSPRTIGEERSFAETAAGDALGAVTTAEPLNTAFLLIKGITGQPFLSELKVRMPLLVGLEGVL